MTHYHVWFNLKPHLSEEAGLAVISELLAELYEAGRATSFQIFKNSGEPPRSRLLSYHALIEFADSAALSAAMRDQSKRGIHTGAHGKVIGAVSEFHVEVFSSITAHRTPQSTYACEI